MGRFAQVSLTKFVHRKAAAYSRLSTPLRAPSERPCGTLARRAKWVGVRVCRRRPPRRDRVSSRWRRSRCGSIRQKKSSSWEALLFPRPSEKKYRKEANQRGKLYDLKSRSFWFRKGELLCGTERCSLLSFQWTAYCQVPSKLKKKANVSLSSHFLSRSLTLYLSLSLYRALSLFLAHFLCRFVLSICTHTHTGAQAH